jgi:hypothetical protein
MSSYTKFIGDTSIPLELLIVAPSGTPITGASPFSKIRRQSDNYYLDFNGGHFKNSGWTAPTLSLNEVGSIYAPGFYNSIWDSHAIITSPGNYAVEYHPNVPGYGPDTDYITFAYDFATAVGSLIVEGSINPVDLKTAIKEIHVYATGNINRNVISGANTYKDSDNNDVFILTPAAATRTRT